MTLQQLCQAKTSLSGEDILLLGQYEAALPALADLVGGDVFIDCMGQNGVAFVAAQASPQFIPSAYCSQVPGLDASPENEPAVYRAFREGLPFHDTMANTQENRTVLQDVTPLFNGKDLIGVLIAEHDISGQVQMERKYRALSDSLLTESMNVPAPSGTLTVRESNHRIKNDLQLLAGVCRIKGRSAPGEAEKNIWLESAAMILSVSRLHSFFTDLGDIKRPLELRALLDKLSVDLGEYILPGYGVTLVIDSDPILIAADMAVSVILCVNELILNALKHAFPHGNGTITVRARSGNRFCNIVVSDDGSGCAGLSMGTGLKILSDTVRTKLGGEFNLSSGSGGTKAVFTFPLIADETVS